MRPISAPSIHGKPVDHKGGPAVRGQARAAEVHALKAQGLSPARHSWRDSAPPVPPAPVSTPAVEIVLSPEATAVLAAEAAGAPAA